MRTRSIFKWEGSLICIQLEGILLCNFPSIKLKKKKEIHLSFSFSPTNYIPQPLASKFHQSHLQTDRKCWWDFSPLNSTLLTIDNNSSEWMSELSGNLWWLIHHGSIQKDGRDRWTDFFFLNSNNTTFSSSHFYMFFKRSQKMKMMQSFSKTILW